ncbi:unnamed protein product, partial [Prorocentrum cordatum]
EPRGRAGFRQVERHGGRLAALPSRRARERVPARAQQHRLWRRDGVPAASRGERDRAAPGERQGIRRLGRRPRRIRGRLHVEGAPDLQGPDAAARAVEEVARGQHGVHAAMAAARPAPYHRDVDGRGCCGLGGEARGDSEDGRVRDAPPRGFRAQAGVLAGQAPGARAVAVAGGEPARRPEGDLGAHVPYRAQLHQVHRRERVPTPRGGRRGARLRGRR